MPFQVTVDFSQGLELFDREGSGFGPGGPENGCRVSLGENKPVIQRIPWIVHFIAQKAKKEC